MQKCNCYPDIVEDFDDFIDDYTGCPEWHAVYTIELGQLVQSGVFDWSKEELAWEDAAYDAEQYKRVCNYFIKRFYWREISLLPVLQWMNMLQYRLVYELMPKYRPMYERLAQGFAPLGVEDEYYAYPETMLSGNSDYISDGTDEEWERVKEGQTVERYNAYVLEFQALDKSLCDELEGLFTCMYTANTNGL